MGGACHHRVEGLGGDRHRALQLARVVVERCATGPEPPRATLWTARLDVLDRVRALVEQPEVEMRGATRDASAVLRRAAASTARFVNLARRRGPGEVTVALTLQREDGKDTWSLVLVCPGSASAEAAPPLFREALVPIHRERLLPPGATPERIVSTINPENRTLEVDVSAVADRWLERAPAIWPTGEACESFVGFEWEGVLPLAALDAWDERQVRIEGRATSDAALESLVDLAGIDVLIIDWECLSWLGEAAAGYNGITLCLGTESPNYHQHLPGRLELFVQVNYKTRSMDEIVAAIEERMGARLVHEYTE